MISITGDKNIDAILWNLPPALSHKALGSVHYNAAKPLVEKEKLLAPEGPTGNLVDSIGAYRMSFKNATAVGEVRVGPRRRGGYKGFAGHLVEFGTDGRYNKNGAYRGEMPATPFAKPAFDQTKGQVERLIVTDMSRIVLGVMKRKYK
jgi:HK97 gp10 family phage protein